MEIKLTDRYKLKTFDRMNLQLWEFGAVETRVDGVKTGEKRMEWKPLGSYFPDVQSAVADVYGRMQRDSDYAGDLAGALPELERMKDELTQACKGAA